jgi:hypothetical protein
MTHYDKLADWQDAEVEVTVLAVTEAAGGVPVVLAKLGDGQVELWSATPTAIREAQQLASGAHMLAHITKCPPVISSRSYGGLRKSLDRIRFSRLLELRPA